MNDPHENATWVYSYDRGGNILSKVRYAYTPGTLGTAVETIPYTYGDANWKDKLTAYNGKSITYDAIGNPLNDGSWTYEWAVGRQLKKMSRDGQSLTFKYDHNGMRIQKVLEHSWYPETTNYTYHGKLLTHMEVNYTDFDEVEHTDKFHFFYDAQSCPAKVRFNGTIYTYLHNLQGDIVGILDSNGNLVVEYKYDAWGKTISSTGSLAGTLGIRNPFRYRGYVYDEESKFYYLESRFFVPEKARFFNSDTHISTSNDVIANNIFAYCDNSPVMLLDICGEDPWWAIVPDWGFVHRAVQCDIVRKYRFPPLTTERQIDYADGTHRRCDIYSEFEGKIWEIKPYGSLDMGVSQLNDYVLGKIGGKSIRIGEGARFAGRISHLYTPSGYPITVYYWTNPGGVILYRFTIDAKRMKLDPATQTVTVPSTVPATKTVSSNFDLNVQFSGNASLENIRRNATAINLGAGLGAVGLIALGGADVWRWVLSCR